jgi:hypothetical protein
MIGIIVDGEGDYAAFRARYRVGVKVYRADGPRGHLVSQVAIVDAAKRQIAQLKGFGCTVVAIVTDLEERRAECAVFRQGCVDRLRELGYGEDVKIFVADRMLENWILADIAHISSKKVYIKKQARQRKYESMDGKVELKKLFEKGYDYNEVRHGQELFPLLRSAEASKFSVSFANFLAELKLA